MNKNLAIASKIIGKWESRLRDYVESFVLTDREQFFADAIQALFEATERIILEIENERRTTF